MLFSCEDWVGGSGGCIFEQGVGVLATGNQRVSWLPCVKDLV